MPEGLDPAAFPQLQRLRGALAACDYAREYERGLELVVASVRAQL